ncbi:hypothetical protein LTR99_008196 [Exophiala xenobiotica]|uniref:FAD dependent oxidoreductase domain-containing protein n=1 Tax=Vermiconidia calcicola TaxID=1690605 RepID=A0AAV9QKU1_9PEZI|nr:hypothetical protein LTR96_008592 [Exophiala xenobiotica]KAK5539399.1 hypothetical protein LTR23_006620 [Chaetothyriales sp. CCFEE 6169]KAK5543515.1 hypothetical protein LTR25_001129 [Vermiconidia calcicola]KAK5297793.1 hypothetical protein LTR99_008196 [Exophiala xenobiotica]KAK5337838.1 hypothetical protein LTR98_005687 [Exophiala xenobiotica]
MERIIIIGSGVTGLTVANLMRTELPFANITIIAAETPTTPCPSADYASMWAGAHYRPIPRSSRQLEQEFDMALRTAKFMKGIAKEAPEAGVKLTPGVEYLEDPPKAILSLKTGDMYAGPDDEFRVLEQAELPLGVKWGCEYQSYCINVPVYSKWLLDRFLTSGGRVVKHCLSSAAEAFEFAEKNGLGKVSMIVNCSGRNFDQDPKVKSIRGQTVLVKQEYDRTVTRQNRDGTWSFLIPRPLHGGTIIGGTKEIGDMEERPRPQTREQLLRQSVKSFPDFVESVQKFEVVKDNVGRRPWREGGYRIEIESITRDKKIVHGYGAGGRGYELSWGAAEKIVALVKQATTIAPKL